LIRTLLIHNLDKLAFKVCEELKLSELEIKGIKYLNKQYLNDGEFSYPARYRPNHKGIRIFNSIGQNTLEAIIEKIIISTSTPELVDRILAR
jgi:hypothetical protein